MSVSGAAPVIRIAAAIIERADGRLLFVRKHGTTAFMQPGGKLEPGESADAALVRELSEELGLVVTADALRLVGRFDAAAANEPGHRVDAWVYDVPLTGDPVVAAEIAEARWIDPSEMDGMDIAPLSREILVPRVLARRANLPAASE